MPTALLKACTYPGCPELTEGGPCAEHARAKEQHRGTSSSRGYTASWRHFKQSFVNRLITLGILPVCGARLAPGPSPHSYCAANGRLVDRSLDGSDLHLDHDPPLTDEERLNNRAVCDPHRVGLLCAECHNRKTQAEQQAGRV